MSWNLSEFRRRFDQEEEAKATSRVDAAMDIAIILSDLRKHLEDLLVGRAMPRATVDDLPFLQAADDPSALDSVLGQEIELLRRQRAFMQTPLNDSLKAMEREVVAFIQERYDLVAKVLAVPDYDKATIMFRISMDGSTWHTV